VDLTDSAGTSSMNHEAELRAAISATLATEVKAHSLVKACLRFGLDGVVCGNSIEAHSRRMGVIEVEKSPESLAPRDPAVRVGRTRRTIDQLVPELLVVPLEPVVAHEL